MKNNKLIQTKIDIELNCSPDFVDSSSITIPVTGNPLDFLRKMMEKSIKKTLDRKFHLSSIPPGYGKSRFVQSTVSEWVHYGTLEKEGVLIALATKEEIEAYTSGWSLSRHQYAALTSDASINCFGAGSAKANDVPVLLTTHQMIRTRLKNASFEAAECFHFKGKPRALRIWDEGLVPAEPVSIRIDDLHALPSTFRSGYPDFISDIDGLLNDLRGASAGQVVHVPGKAGIGAASVLKGKGVREIDKRTLEAIMILSGQKALIGKENRRGLTLVGCGPRLPDDLAPLFVLDGSGDIRATYKQWEASRSDLVRFPSIAVDHSPLSIHLWERGCGRETMRHSKERQPIIDAIVELVNDQADEEWLIIHRREKEDNLPTLLEPHLTKPENVRYRHWGLHHGTNQFRTIKNLLIIGGNNYAETAYDAYCLAASGVAPDGTVSAYRKEIEFGELCHHLRQAVYRGNARNHSGGKCGESRVHLINSSPGIERAPNAAFPGCTVEHWTPSSCKLQLWMRLRDEIIGAFKKPKVNLISKKEITEKLGISKQNATRIWKSEKLVNAMRKEGIVVGRTVLSRTASPVVSR